MARTPVLATAALLAILVFSGCVGQEAQTRSIPVKALVGGKVNFQPGAGINKSSLTQPIYEMLPKVRNYVPALLDGIRLYVEVFLPKGPGPWPTIMINSPYYEHGLNGANDLEAAFRQYFVPRGYAVVLADVRGTGFSEGCMNMMGAKEQADTYALVEWVASQSWSDGKVGMYGVSYVGTTPHEALIMAPPHLVTVVTVAGVTNQWRNMYQNGVPYNGRFYPLTYELIEGAPPPTDPDRGADWARNTANGACEQEEAVRHVAPGTYEKGVYDAYWKERNFTLKAKNVKASLFYNQGFTDRAVNPMEAVHWYSEIESPKKAFFGQWPHRTPDRKDWQTTLNAWFDHWLKGIDNGIMTTPQVEVVTNKNTIRVDADWPPKSATALRLFLSPGKLQAEAPAAVTRATYMADNAVRGYEGELQDAAGGVGPRTRLTFQSDPLESDVYMAGIPWAHLRASVNADNTYFLLSLYDVDGAAWREVAEGWMNAHLWESFEKSSPLVPGREYTFDFKFEPREYVFGTGHRIGLIIKGHDARVFPFDQPVTQNTIVLGGEHPSSLELPVLLNPATVNRPAEI